MNFALVIVDSLATLNIRIRSIVLSLLAVVAGIIVYIAVAPTGGTSPAVADAVAVPPLVRADPIDMRPPNIVRVPAEGLSRPIATPVLPPDRNSLVRELQKALAQAGCYDGPITGIWSNASKDAMRGFVGAVNAQLPVDDPDQSLVALVESNEGATCTHGRVVYTGALTAQPVPQAPSSVAEPGARLISSRPSSSSDAAPTSAADDGRSMIDRPWAPADMLVPPKDMAAAKDATTTNDTSANNTATNDTTTKDVAARDVAATPPPIVRVTVESREPAAAQTPSTVSDPAPVIHFESNQAVPDPRADAVADPATGATPAPPPTKTAQKKTKKRRPSDSDDMQTSISKGFYSLQKQWSSMFD